MSCTVSCHAMPCHVILDQTFDRMMTTPSDVPFHELNIWISEGLTRGYSLFGGVEFRGPWGTSQKFRDMSCDIHTHAHARDN